MRSRRLYRAADRIVEWLDDRVYQLRALVERLDPGFTPVPPPPEPSYINCTTRCDTCGIVLAFPVLSTAPPPVIDAVRRDVQNAHIAADHEFETAYDW